MVGTAALARFLQARSDTSERASARAGIEQCAYLAELLDASLAVLTVASGQPGLALIAVGGYGRGEQSRHSDVDVMLLVDRGVEEGATRLLYPLWDAGLKVGHSVRTVPQVAEAAHANVETFTALLDARFIAGEPRLWVEFEEARRQWARGQREWLRARLAERRAALVAREPWQLLAVDLKNGRGGLRDIQAVHWLAAVEAAATGAEEAPLPPALVAAREHLLATRNAVHAGAERPTDVYRPETAVEVGRWLGEDPFEWGRSLYATMRTVDAAAALALQPPEERRRWWQRPRRPEPAPPSEPSHLAQMRAALSAVRQGGPLEPLPRAPWLERLLPEWEVLRARPHVAAFHVHPVDVHAVRTVAEAHHILEHDEFEAGTPAVGREFGRSHELLLAALLHDIGKGHGVDHPEAGAVMAERFAARAGLPAEEAVRLVAAVRHHLLLPGVATRRDIADTEVIRETAATVGDANTLRLLYLLAVADARASGPDVWNQWKAQLMLALYRRVLAVLQTDRPDAAIPRLESVVEALAGRIAEADVRAHLGGLASDYLMSTAPKAIGDHIELIRTAAGRTAATMEPLGAIDRLTIVSPDRPGLLQDVAGTLAGLNASVLGGVAYTHTDGTAIEVWHVRDALGVGLDDRRRQRILDAIPRAVEGAYDIDDRLAEVARSYPQPARRGDIGTLVHLDNAASREYSVLEISTPDRRGLLYAVTRTLHEMGFDIHLAKVDTIGPEVVDAFYIRRQNGRRVEEPDEIERLERRITEVLSALD